MNDLRERLARALHRADVEPRRFDPHWNVHEWPELTDEAREYWRRLADAIMLIVREAVREGVEQVTMFASVDHIVRRVCGE